MGDDVETMTQHRIGFARTNSDMIVTTVLDISAAEQDTENVINRNAAGRAVINMAPYRVKSTQIIP
jgi:hypothetical protein